jgi:hypothetical protein
MALARFVSLTLLVVVLGGVSAGAAQADPPERGSVEWGGRSFSSADELARWFALRNKSYEVWAVRHPDAARRIRPRVNVLPRPELSVQSTATPIVAGAAAGVGAALLLLALAALPISVLVRVHPLRNLPRRRFELATSGIVLLLAVAMLAALSSSSSI